MQYSTGSFHQKIAALLYEHGLMDAQINPIMKAVISSELLEPMKDRWDHQVADYPASVLATTWLSVEKIARKWLKENQPDHFALAMFGE